MDKNTKDYLVKFFSAMAVYLVMVYAAKQGVGMTKNIILQHIMAVVPIVPVLFAANLPASENPSLVEIRYLYINRLFSLRCRYSHL